MSSLYAKFVIGKKQSNLVSEAESLCMHWGLNGKAFFFFTACNIDDFPLLLCIFPNVFTIRQIRYRKEKKQSSLVSEAESLCMHWGINAKAFFYCL